MEAIPSLRGPSQAFVVLITAWLGYQLLKILYNVSPLHPLSSIPGPRLAAASYLPEFYHDVILLGRYTHQIRRMHEIYGPLVRINPNEVHCNDPDFADEIFAGGGRKRNKSSHQVDANFNRHSGFATVDHDRHRSRRAPLSKFFSRASIARLEGDIAELTQKLCDKILAHRGQEQPFDITIAYSNLTTDTISGYCFGKQFGLSRFVDNLPQPLVHLVRIMQIEMPRRIEEIREGQRAGVLYERPTIIGAILDSDLRDKEKSTSRVADESFAVVGAGTETTAWALTVMTHRLLSNREILERLTQELQHTVKDPRRLPSWTVLEKLPYLSAVIQESLRLSYGVSARTARVATQEDLVYQGEWDKKPIRYVIPRGYAIGMSAVITHHDENIFPRSHEFRPDRWLDPERRRELERGILGFGKGSRACLGMNLALCELHLAAAALTLRVFPYMRLFETTEEDLRYDYDTIVPMPKRESRGVRATVV
ncbi:hypothetical protein VPNG_09114 [Cytospora leucostoma]|uniref:Cytochrome P450 n=1 Tax=Cytospora leucostoma TaxID=1230097 RepID=A0A423VP85_9PEZI|nr:hypothetical protein VPNG_09114 [Cytospora leucostoma]